MKEETKKMKQQHTVILPIFSLIAAVLFLIGGIRFYLKEDTVGVIINGIAFGCCLITAIGSYFGRKRQ